MTTLKIAVNDNSTRGGLKTLFVSPYFENGQEIYILEEKGSEEPSYILSLDPIQGVRKPFRVGTEKSTGLGRVGINVKRWDIDKTDRRAAVVEELGPRTIRVTGFNKKKQPERWY